MEFLKYVTRENDGEVFTIGDKVFGIGAGEYFIGRICIGDCLSQISGIEVAGYKNLNDVYKNIEYPELCECGFNDINKIRKQTDN